MKYAEKTNVSAVNSRNEIEKILSRYNADGFMYGWQGPNAIVAFEMNDRRIKFTLPLPDKEFYARTESGRSRHHKGAIELAWEQGCRQRWRALALAIKAKLEAVSSGITTFEEEFLAHIMLPNGQTVGSWMQPQIAHSYQEKKMPPLLGHQSK